MPLSDAEIKSAVATVKATLSTSVGGSAADFPAVRLPGGMWGCVTCAARRVDVAAGLTPDQWTGMDFAAAALMLGLRAVASPTVADQVQLSRFGW